MQNLSKLAIALMFLFSISVAAFAQEPDPNFSKKSNEKTRQQPKQEAQKPDAAKGHGDASVDSNGQQAPGKPQQASAGGAGDLQKAVQNPVASLISVPVQNNSNFGIGPFDRTQNVLNIQPVIPLRISEDWNLIIRWIAPIIWQPAPGTANLEVFGIEENTPAYLAAQNVQKSAGVFGFGDMTPSFFFSPAKPGKLIWGAGPVFVLPTATSKVLGQGKLSMGPSFVALVQPGKWTVGALVNNVWSVVGPSDRTAVSQMTFQYFVNYKRTVLGRARFTYFRLYGPLEAYFDKTWPLPDIEKVP